MEKDLKKALLEMEEPKKCEVYKIGFEYYSIDDELEIVEINGGYGIYTGEEENWHTVRHLPSLEEEGKLADGYFEFLHDETITVKELLELIEENKNQEE